MDVYRGSVMWMCVQGVWCGCVGGSEMWVCAGGVRSGCV